MRSLIDSTLVAPCSRSHARISSVERPVSCILRDSGRYFFHTEDSVSPRGGVLLKACSPRTQSVETTAKVAVITITWIGGARSTKTPVKADHPTPTMLTHCQYWLLL